MNCCYRPSLMRTRNVVSDSDTDVSGRPRVDDIRQLLRWDRLDWLVRILPEEPRRGKGHSYKIYHQPEAVTAPLGLDFIRPDCPAFAGVRPAAFPWSRL